MVRLNLQEFVNVYSVLWNLVFKFLNFGFTYFLTYDTLLSNDLSLFFNFFFGFKSIFLS